MRRRATISETARVTEAEASARAQRLNTELGRAGERNAFYLEVEIRPGDWDVALQGEPKKQGRLSAFWQGFLGGGDQNPPGTYGL